MKKAEKEEMLREKLKNMKAFEARFYGEEAEFLGGVDEIDRGPLTRPVVAACVVLPRDFSILGIDDSKKLTEKKRNEMAIIIRESALAYGLAMAATQIGRASCRERV